VKLQRRWVVFYFVLMVLFFLGMVYWPYVYSQVLIPISTAVWLLLRLFVLSIGQLYYWIALILGMILLLYQVLSGNQVEMESEPTPFPNETVSSIQMWRRIYMTGDALSADDRTIKQQMAHMLVALHANRLHIPPDFKLYDALRRGDIPLPPRIRDMAFHEEPPQKVPPLKRFVLAARSKPAQWYRHATGQDKAEHYRMIDEMLTYLETSLEINNDSK